MTEKQQEFQTNLVQFLANIGREATLEDIIPIYHVSFSWHRRRQTMEHLSKLLTRLEQNGVIHCSWVVARDTDVVRSVALRRTAGAEITQQQSSH